MGLYGVDIRDYGASTDYADNAPYIADAAAVAGSDKTLIIPDGVWRHASTPIVIHQTDGMHITSLSSAATLLATGAHPSIIIDSANHRVDHGEIKNIRLASLTNAQGSDGIRLIGDPVNFINGWRFADLRLSGLHNGIACQKGERDFGGVNVSLFSGNMITNWMVDEWENTRTQRGLYADGVNTLNINGGYSRAEIATVHIGNGVTGWGDFIMTGVHTNYGAHSVYLLGSTQVEDYRHNAIIVGNQFDGANTVNVYARNVRTLTVGPNNYASGIQNDILDCRQVHLDWDPSYTEDAIVKEAVYAGNNPALFKLQGPTGSAGFGAAVVEVTLSAVLTNMGGANWKGTFPVEWSNGVPSFGPADIRINRAPAGASISVGCYKNTSNELVFVAYHNTPQSGSRFLANVKVQGDGFKYMKC